MALRRARKDFEHVEHAKENMLSDEGAAWKKSMRDATRTFFVYVIEARLAETRKPLLYVGVSAHTPDTRLKEHMYGKRFVGHGRTRGGRTERVGRGLRNALCSSFRLRRDLAPRTTFATRDEALKAEKKVAAKLREHGYRVKGGT